jgi:hypothetical protein
MLPESLTYGSLSTDNFYNRCGTRQKTDSNNHNGKLCKNHIHFGEAIRGFNVKNDKNLNPFIAL